MFHVRVLYYYRGQQVDTGSPRALLGFIDLLDRSRFTPLFLATPRGPLAAALESRGVEIVEGHANEVSYRRPITACRMVLAQARFLRRLRVNILHLNEFGWNLDLVLGAWLARIPIILHVHLPGEIAFGNLHRIAADRIILVSRAQQHALAHFNRIRHKCHVIPNPVDLASFTAGTAIRQDLGLNQRQLVVGTVAQVRYGKGIDIVLGAAKTLCGEMPEVVFVIVGPIGHGEEEFGEKIMRMACLPEFDGRVRFLGPRSDIANVLASLDVFLLPTRGETFGIAVIEAMAAGLPVVVSQIDALQEIVNSPEIGVTVPTLEADAFTDALRSVLRSSDGRKRMGELARRSLKGRFDGPTIATKLHEIYESLLPRT